MPQYEDYYSDASLSSDTESDDDEEPQELYDPRDEDYWAIESLLESRKPPPAVEYLTDVGAFALRECVVSSLRDDIDAVVDVKSVSSWHSFWNQTPSRTHAKFSHDDWDAIGEFAMQLCECCMDSPSMPQIRSCIIRMLSLGHFVPKRLVVALPRARRR